MTQCDESVYRPDEPFSHRNGRCSRAAKVERDGKHYCTQHDPERLKARAEQRQSERQQDRDRRRAEDRLKLAAPDLLAACESLANITECYCPDGIDVPCWFCRAKAAIAKARGK